MRCSRQSECLPSRGISSRATVTPGTEKTAVATDNHRKLDRELPPSFPPPRSKDAAPASRPPPPQKSVRSFSLSIFRLIRSLWHAHEEIKVFLAIRYSTLDAGEGQRCPLGIFARNDAPCLLAISYGAYEQFYTNIGKLTTGYVRKNLTHGRASRTARKDINKYSTK